MRRRGGDDLVQDITDQGSTVNKPDIVAVTAALKLACQRRVEQGQRVILPVRRAQTGTSAWSSSFCACPASLANRWVRSALLSRV